MEGMEAEIITRLGLILAGAWLGLSEERWLWRELRLLTMPPPIMSSEQTWCRLTIRNILIY